MPMSPRLLRPRSAGFHPEAQRWRNAVIANGGTASRSTVNAVSRFCSAIDAAGLRDRFARLSLFCGDNLQAALIPLYRGPTATGTQFGNETDVNNGPFVSADYVQSSGLQGNGTSKFLNTGVPMNFASLRNYHLAAYVASVTSGNGHLLGADTSGDGVSPRAFQALVTFASATRIWVWYNIATNFLQADNTSNSYAPGLLAGVGSSAANNLYAGASSVASTTAAANETVSRTFPLYVFATNNRNNSALTFANARLGAYSIGFAMTASQIAAYNAALLSFNQSLGRA